MTELEKAAREYAKRTSECTGEESTNVDDLIAFQAGAEWKSEQSPWISIEERLPSSDNDLYIALNTKMTPPGIDVCEFDVKSKRWTDSRHVVVYPTHWMTIPKLS